MVPSSPAGAWNNQQTSLRRQLVAGSRYLGVLSVGVKRYHLRGQACLMWLSAARTRFYRLICRTLNSLRLSSPERRSALQGRPCHFGGCTAAPGTSHVHYPLTAAQRRLSHQPTHDMTRLRPRTHRCEQTNEPPDAHLAGSYPQLSGSYRETSRHASFARLRLLSCPPVSVLFLLLTQLVVVIGPPTTRQQLRQHVLWPAASRTRDRPDR